MRYGFNLKYDEYLKDIESNEVYQYNLIKNKALITGDGNVVRYFYRKIAPSVTTGRLADYIMQDVKQSFLYQHTIENAFVFYGITKMINRGIVRLITSGGVTIKGKYEERIKKLFDSNKFEKIWHESVKEESGVGDVILRVANDNTVADHPIIEVIEAENYELVIKRGFIVGYIIKVRKEVEKDFYEMHEVYGKDADGRVHIEYIVYDPHNNKVDLRDGTDRSNKIIVAFGLDKLKLEIDTFPIQYVDVNHIPIIYKSNTETNKGKRGIADTDGMETLESALSEVLSDMVDEIRKAGLKILIDQRIQPIDETGKPIPFNHFNKDIILTKSEGQDADKLIQTAQGLVRSDKYIESSKYLIAIACNKAGIHPLTVGITGVESIVASAESQQEREGKTSLRKREEKLIEWKQTIKELCIRLLEMDDLLNGLSNDAYTHDDFEISFGKYTNPNPESIVAITQQRINAGIESMKEAIKRDNPDTSPEQIDTIYAQVKVEKGIALTAHEMQLLGIEPPQIQPQNNESDV